MAKTRILLGVFFLVLGLGAALVGRVTRVDPPNVIRISVFDSSGEKPIRAFRVIAGVRGGSAVAEFEKHTGRTVINWQPHTLRLGADGACAWPLERAYDEMALRVEADGYQAHVTGWIKKADGPRRLFLQLLEDPGVAGRVVRPDGKPAAGAMVALAMAHRDAVLDDGRLRGAGEKPPDDPGDRWRRPILVQTDAEGRFRLPTETVPAALLVIHDSGVRELAYTDFRKTPDIKLQRWGRIEGRVLWKGRPGANEPVSLTIVRDDYGYPGVVASYARTRSDAQGRFVFDRVLPGRAQLSRPITLPEPGMWAATEDIFDGLYVHVDVRSGASTPVLIGGQGRKLRGRLTGLDDWDNVTIHFHPHAPHVGFGGDNSWAAFGIFSSSAIGPLFFRNKLPVDVDGSFEIDDLLPGRYQFFVSAPGFRTYAAYRTIEINPETPGQAPVPLDLGEIPVKARVGKNEELHHRSNATNSGG